MLGKVRLGTAILSVCLGWFLPADFYVAPCSVQLFLGAAEKFSCSNWV